MAEQAKAYMYTVIFIKEPEGGYSVLVPALPGCFSQGETIPESIEMAREAIEVYLEGLMIHDEPIPEEGETITFDRGDLTEGFIFRVTAKPEVRVYAQGTAGHVAEVG